jgi:hypothetical protein
MNTEKSLLEAQNQPSFLGAVMRSYLPNIKMLRKENFYTKEPVKILRITFFGKVWFYHLTFKRFI